jgi:hypothetical protein
MTMSYIKLLSERWDTSDRAYVSMKIVLSNGGKEIINRIYSSEGDSKGGQMWGAGPFGMKNATLDSTRSAIDKILTQFINDIPKA